jgi:hypothetical protein
VADRSPFEAAALRYCAPRGIRLSDFTDLWPEADQWAALEWQATEDGRCPSCGGPADECLADEDDAPDYEVEVRRCHRTQVQAMEEREMAKDGDPGKGLVYLVRKKAS